MPASQDSLKGRLALYREVTLTVTGRKTGREISIPVWFVMESSDTLYLMPVQGSDTQWYKNVLRNPEVRISARDKEGKFQATPITDPKVVMHVIEAFRSKYGAADVKKYYSKFDVVVRVALSRGSADGSLKTT